MLCKKYYLVLAVAILSASVKANHSIVKRTTTQPRKYDCACHTVSNPATIISLGVFISAGFVLVVLSALIAVGLAVSYSIRLLLSGKVIPVVSILPHHQYNPSDHNCDLAILKLKENAVGSNIGPCNIAPAGYKPPSSVTVFGCPAGFSLIGGIIGTLLGGLKFLVTSLTVGSCGIPSFNPNNLCCTACGIDAIGSSMTSADDVVIALLVKPVNCASGHSGYVNCYDQTAWLTANK